MFLIARYDRMIGVVTKQSNALALTQELLNEVFTRYTKVLRFENGKFEELVTGDRVTAEWVEVKENGPIV